MTRKAAGPALCPSAPAAPGAKLIGVVGTNGRVTNLVTPLTVDAAFVRIAKAGGPPEERFRFSSPCQEAKCSNWSGRNCGLIGKLHQAAAEIGAAGDGKPLSPCAIRPRCRWWQQRGREACGVCSLVITDQTSGQAAASA